MIMKKSIFIILIGFLIQNCGFTVLEQTNLKYFYIKEINATGNNRINYDLKNNLIIKSGNKKNKPLVVSINSSKKKNIKEKNNKNVITKYLIQIDLVVKVESNNKLVKTINLSEQRDFNVSTQYSQTINNEKQVTKDITDKMVEKIIKEISIIKPNDL